MKPGVWLSILATVLLVVICAVSLAQQSAPQDKGALDRSGANVGMYGDRLGRDRGGRGGLMPHGCVTANNQYLFVVVGNQLLQYNMDLELVKQMDLPASGRRPSAGGMGPRGTTRPRRSDGQY